MKSFRIISAVPFACGRTCTPGHECRFAPIFNAIGRTRVVSHTVKVETEFRDKGALAGAVKAMGGEVLGDGVHSLFQGSECGFGFKLPGWQYPVILRADNTLAFDDYHGMWGNVADLATLTGDYNLEVASIAAAGQGWMSDREADGTLTIYHPSGGTMTVNRDGTVEANGFVGKACDVARIISDSIGSKQDRSDKPEYYTDTQSVEY